MVSARVSRGGSKRREDKDNGYLPFSCGQLCSRLISSTFPRTLRTYCAIPRHCCRNVIHSRELSSDCVDDEIAKGEDVKLGGVNLGFQLDSRGACSRGFQD